MNDKEKILYAWDEENKQVLRFLKSNYKTDFVFGSADHKRMLVYDCDYAGFDGYSPHKYGTYLFSLDNLLIGFWEPLDVTHFTNEFRVHLLLLGLEFTNDNR